MNFYPETKQFATAMLKEFGSTCPIKRIAKVFNPAGGGTTTSTQSGVVYVLQMDVVEATKELAGIELSADDQGAWVSATSFAPEEKDTITIKDLETGASTVWKVGKVFPLRPGAITLMYKMQLTR